MNYIDQIFINRYSEKTVFSGNFHVSTGAGKLTFQFSGSEADEIAWIAKKSYERQIVKQLEELAKPMVHIPQLEGPAKIEEGEFTEVEDELPF